MPTHLAVALVIALGSLALLAGAVLQYRDGRRDRSRMLTASCAATTTLVAAGALVFAT